MKEAIENYLEGFRDTCEEVCRLCYVVRGKEFQQDGAKELSRLKKQAGELKSKAVEEQDNDSANMMLSCETFIDSVIHELLMWIAFKDDDPNSAWDHLISSQNCARISLRAHDWPLARAAETRAEKLHLIERIVFPPQSFLSTGMTVERTDCSICGTEYGECEHVVGRAYMGEMCCRIIRDIAELSDVSFVETPSDKRCRVTQLNFGGVERDIMTYREIGENNKQL